MRISVIMIDGQFRENTFGAEYFSCQDFPKEEYEVIWVEFYSRVPESVTANPSVKVITLNNPETVTYHSSYCFNAGIAAAKGELIVIPDADQIVKPDFLSTIYRLHEAYDRLVIYPYRYDEINQGVLKDYTFEELDRKCMLKNPLNYGGCLTVRKKWLLEINGYEQHKILSSGFHANGSDMYTRFKNLGLAVMWTHDTKLYHPWHPFTLAAAEQYTEQLEFIEWRKKNMEYLAVEGIDASRNSKTFSEEAFAKVMEAKTQKPAEAAPAKPQGLLNRMFGR